MCIYNYIYNIPCSHTFPDQKFDFQISPQESAILLQPQTQRLPFSPIPSLLPLFVLCSLFVCTHCERCNPSLKIRDVAVHGR